METQYQEFIFTSRYAKWLEGENRRETLRETVARYIDNIVKPKISKSETISELEEAIFNFDIMPSMRALMTAGKAADRDNTCIYNCAYLPVDDPKSFDEAMFILMCGTGVGFSVEQENVNKLPEVPDLLFESETCIKIHDSKEGWSKGLRQLLALLWSGEIPEWDTSKVRGPGERLKTFGGRSSGPQPLEDLFDFIVNIFKSAKGRKLTSLECHDIMCKIGEIVVVGGVRRSAMISLSDLTDCKLAKAKSGNWWEKEPQRALANNSACYNTKPDLSTFMGEWLSLMESGSGERGIFNREASIRQASRNNRRSIYVGKPPAFDGSINNNRFIPFGTNPCSEIILRPYQFCNLTEVIARENDDVEDLIEKVRLATILGTIQSTYTNFPYLRKVWQKNTEEERLLGVSITGIIDCKLLQDGYNKYLLEILKQTAIDTNKEWADILGIPQSTAITCVKPSGTVSQLVDSSSGIHARFAPYYIRTVRGDNKDPLTQFMIEQGVPNEPCVLKPDTTTVFSFPQKSPEGAIYTKEYSALDQLQCWLNYQRYWCEHKPSVTIMVKEDEWLDVGAFVYKHFDEMSGVSFLPLDNHTYKQAPYQEITEEEYLELVDQMPQIEWKKLSDYEKEDNTKSSQSLACTGGVCELVDI